MAKSICAEWAGVLLGNGVTVQTGAFQQKFDNWFQQSGLNGMLFSLAEEAFASGSGAVVLFPSGENNAAVSVVGAGGIYPLAWSDRKITSCAFAFPTTREGKHCTLLQLHLPGSTGYSIESTLLDDETGEELPTDQLGFEKVIATGSFVPLYAFFLPGASLSYTGGYPLGASVYAGAVSSLGALEQIQRSLAAEFTLGRKRLLLPPYMTKQDGQGKPVFDTSDSVFCSPPGENASLPADLSTTLRAEEHTAALAAATEFLRTACGLGKTPAEEPALVRTYRARFAQMLTEMVVSAARLLGQSEPERVDILFDSLPSPERIAANAALVRDGLRSKVSALSNLLGCSDTAAERELEKVSAQAVERTGV